MLRNTPGLCPVDARIMPPPPSVIPNENVSRHCHTDLGGQNHPLVRTAALETMTSEFLLFFTAYPYVVAVQSLSHVQLFSIPWTAAFQASMSLAISWSLTLMYAPLKQGYCLVLLFSDFVESNHTAYIFLWLFKINIIFVKCNHCVLYTVVHIHYF